MDTQAFVTAIALMLIFEGIGPFVNPRGMRKLYARMAQTPDGTLRVASAVTIAAGLVLLTWIRNG